MRSTAITAITAVAALVALATPNLVAAQDAGSSPFELSVMGGIQGLNENDSAFPDNFVNIPVVATASYRLTHILAIDGEFTWMIPVEQDVDLSSGAEADRKSPDILAYQANLRANWSDSRSAWSPYVAAGAGAVTFLSNEDADRMPQLAGDETAFAINFGAGVSYNLNRRWALRADFREFVAFPSDDAAGLATDGSADEVWMPRGTIGAAYRF